MKMKRREHKTSKNFRLSKHIVQQLQKASHYTGRSESMLVEMALEFYFLHHPSYIQNNESSPIPKASQDS